MTITSKILATAKAEVGTKETFAGGHWVNDSKYNKWFGRIPGYGRNGYDYPWCAVFVSWVADKAGAASLYPRTAGCATAVAWFKARGRFSEYPAIGAQVFYGAGGGTHTGLVYDYDDTYVYSYEGNTNTSGSAEGDGVYAKKRRRRDAYVYGYGLPKFPEGIVSADPAFKNEHPDKVTAPPAKPDTPAKPADRAPDKWLTVTGTLPELRHGMTGWYVGWLQRNLNRFGHGLTVTSVYDDATAKAVNAFYAKELGYKTTTKGKVFGAGGWRRVLSLHTVSDKK
jgi:hypothetical protein